jgi:hypothetical protein
MTEDEARSILQEIRKVSDLQWDAMPDLELLELRLQGVCGRAFAATRHIPDPDHPQRTAPCLYTVYLPDPESFLRGCVKHELEGLEVPDSVAEIDGRRWVSIDPSSTLTGPEKSGGSAGRDRYVFEGLRWNRTSALTVAAGLCVFLFLYGAWSRMHPDPKPASDLPPNPPPISYADVRRWNETKSKLKELLQEPWARKNAGIERPDDLKDQKLLDAFAGLFRRPDISQLPDSEGLSELMQTRFDAHPFTAFLHRLPRKVPPTPEPAADGQDSRQGLDFLFRLASTLKESGIDLDTKTADRLVQTAKRALDYHEFFDDWPKGGKKEETDYWCEGDKTPARWVEELRSIIKTKYPFYK